MNTRASSDGLDRDGLLRRVDGDRKLLREIADLFTEDTPVMLAQIKAAIRSRNAAEIERSSHRLKGALTNLGAKTAADLASRLERRSRQKKLDGLDKTVARLESEIPRLTAELQALIERKRE